jgi:4-amino-4-deoxy-L-arabinose transferase-like glycosyltransferase
MPLKKQHKVHHEPPAKKFNFKSPVVTLVIIAILAAIPFSLGKYIEFNSPGAFDSGAYVYSAKRILEGAKIGIDEKPSAQMGTLLINMLGVRLFGFNEIGPKLIQTFLQAGALLLMFAAMLKLFGVLPAAVGVIVASTYLSAPLIAKFGNVKEQYMIAFMILGISSYVLHQLNNKWWYAVLAGAFVSWAPLFKETGFSVFGALGLFVITQPLLKNKTWKKTGTDILLLFAGAALAIGPICLWLAVEKAPSNYFPYSSLWRPVAKVLQGSQTPGEPKPAELETDTDANTLQSNIAKQELFMKLMPAYVRDSWQILKPEQIKQAKLRVFRWYGVLILPIALALGSIIMRIIVFFAHLLSPLKYRAYRNYDRFVLLFAVWWILDMSFVWISPRSYEQYYLPLNASAAMLGGYVIAIYRDKVKNTIYKPHYWILAGFVGLIVMIIMSWHIFFGVRKSPHSGTIYRSRATGMPEKKRGYEQRLAEAVKHYKGEKGTWEVVGEYIRNNSTTDDGIYVWGWVPGIYVAAQRLSPAPKASEGTMHTLKPQVLSERVTEILNAFEKKPPKFIVDSRKSHFPWDRPPLELWPQTPQGFLPTDEQIVNGYDKAYAKMLGDRYGPAEALRYKAMKPLRDYVMKNYKVVRTFGRQVLFQRK